MYQLRNFLKKEKHVGQTYILDSFNVFNSPGCAEQGHPAERKKRAPADAWRSP